MAETKIGGDEQLFVGEDKTISVHVKDADGASVNATGWTTSLVIRRRDGTGTALLTKAGSISGSYAAQSNPQRVIFSLTDTETGALDPGVYRYSIKRTDDGYETILLRGDIEFEDSTQR